ncbi:hypothetical protein CBR_g45404 [Chara braunii]|uniref:Flavodoxin-like domain-containing protein n=1 Tax=Chara braunii TaxID=69332 RepID=A0A388LYE4_CHABU|nr:hypothetical protein CBR_g45404 [Chara braunii]|eukprot:GBG87344.1 hypothetical protein CBR_g45404 [Chara braunii]
MVVKSSMSRGASGNCEASWVLHRCHPRPSPQSLAIPVGTACKLLATAPPSPLQARYTHLRNGRMPVFPGLTRSPLVRKSLCVRCAAEATQVETKDQNQPPQTSQGEEKKEVRILSITDDTQSLRARCQERLKFEIEYGLKRGTTDNAYLIRGDNCVALINVPDESFSKTFVSALTGVIGLDEISYLVLGHLSPKRLDALFSLLNARSAKDPLQVYCSNPAAKLLLSSLPEGITDGQQLKVNVVKADGVLDLGKGHKLQLLLTPTPRWPDGMCVYDPFNQLLYTHKLFSAHVCTESDFDVGGWELFGSDWQFFYDCMLAPTPTQAASALEKLPIVAQFEKPSYKGKSGLTVAKADLSFVWSSIMRLLNLSPDKAAALARMQADGDSNGALVVSAICPIHGPIVRTAVTELVREYRQWTEEKVKQNKDVMIAVIYASAYGNTAALAQAISRGISKAGVGIETINCEFTGSEEVVSVVRKSGGFVIGSPTLAGHMPTPVQEALGGILRDSNARSKPCGVFGSFGWSGEAVDEMEQRLKDGGFSFGFPPIRCKFKPTEATLQLCEESGTDLAQVVIKAQRKKDSTAKPTFSTASDVEQAVGRVVGSLCVLAARSGDAESAMLASWVSQASFVPPGITIAVAKDRAVEGLILPGGKFALNILGQGKAGPISKQLLKPFKPGEPRFGDLPISTASNGCTLLDDALAHLECSVVNRMETGDHWIVYATVDSGKLIDDSSLTAVHHRKTGSRY